MRHRPTRIAATADVPAAADDVFGLVADLDRHVLLTDHRMQILHLDGPVGARSGGVIELRGPLGLRRRARTRVGEATFPSRLTGTARTESGSRAVLRWRLEPSAGGTRVRAELEIEATPFDRLLMLCGGRRWLAQLLRDAVLRLPEAEFSTVEEGTPDGEQDDVGAPVAVVGDG